MPRSIIAAPPWSVISQGAVFGPQPPQTLVVIDSDREYTEVYSIMPTLRPCDEETTMNRGYTFGALDGSSPNNRLVHQVLAYLSDVQHVRSILHRNQGDSISASRYSQVGLIYLISALADQVPHLAYVGGDHANHCIDPFPPFKPQAGMLHPRTCGQWC